MRIGLHIDLSLQELVDIAIQVTGDTSIHWVPSYGQPYALQFQSGEKRTGNEIAGLIEPFLGANLTFSRYGFIDDVPHAFFSMTESNDVDIRQGILHSSAALTGLL